MQLLICETEVGIRVRNILLGSFRRNRILRVRSGFYYKHKFTVEFIIICSRNYDKNYNGYSNRKNVALIHTMNI